jgi:hypothetical protein
MNNNFMTKTITLLVAFGAIAMVGVLAPMANAQAESTTLTNRNLRLSFDHPRNWQIERDRSTTRITIPIEGTDRTATLQIFEAEFGMRPEQFQDAQRTAAEAMRRTVDRQWQEILLNVPLLLTQVRFVENDREQVTLVGLLFSRSKLKMLFRLTADAEDFRDVESLWRQVLTTLRTTTGVIPEAENPDEPLTGKEPDPKPTPRPTGPTRSTTLTVESLQNDQPVQRAPNSLTVQAGTREFNLFYPEGWTATQEEGGYRFNHAEVPGGVWIAARTISADGQPGRALFAMATKSLEDFQRVLRRDEPRLARNRGGVTVGWVLRQGEGVNGQPLFTWEAFGINTDAAAYWIAQYRSESAQSFDRARTRIRDLFDRMSIEPVQ